MKSMENRRKKYFGQFTLIAKIITVLAIYYGIYGRGKRNFWVPVSLDSEFYMDFNNIILL
jgi:hypothetical protein